MVSSLLLTLCLASTVTVSTKARPVWDVWPKGNPNGWTLDVKEVTEKATDADFLLVKQVSHPTLEFFKAPKAAANAPTVIIFPGGGYYVVAIEHEGWEIAQRLNKAGIHAAVLKYRLPDRNRDKILHLPALQDAQRSIRMLRSRSAELGIDGSKIGILGFSAGGHLAAVAATADKAMYDDQDAIDKVSPRPDFCALIYAAYLNQEGTVKLMPEITVDKATPPTFILQTEDDFIPLEAGMSVAIACRAAGVPTELHLFPKGGHGYGLRTKEGGLKEWPNLVIDWIKRITQ